MTTRMSKDGSRVLREWAEKAARAGWRVTRTRNSHLKWQSPDGKVVFSAGTPGAGRRSLENTRSDLRRAGLEI